MPATYPQGLTRTRETHQWYSSPWSHDSRTSVRCQSLSVAGKGNLFQDPVGGATTAETALVDGDPVHLHGDPEGRRLLHQGRHVGGGTDPAQGEVRIERTLLGREAGPIDGAIDGCGQHRQRLEAPIGADPEHRGPLPAGKGPEPPPP